MQKKSFPPTVSQKLPASQPLANKMHTIYRKFHEEIERPGVGKLLKSFRNGDGEPTISYRCSATSMTFGFGDPLHSLPLGWMPTWRKDSSNATFGAKKPKCR